MGNHLNTVVSATLADCMKNRDFRSADRDKAWKTGTVPAKTGRMVGLVIGSGYFVVNGILQLEAILQPDLWSLA